MYWRIVMSMNIHSYTVHIEQAAEGGFWSRVPSLSGCYSQGDTLETAIQNTKEAIELYLEGFASRQEEIPYESDTMISVRIPVAA